MFLIKTFLALVFVPPEEVFPLAMSALGRLLLGKELVALSAKLRLPRLKSLIFASAAFFHPSFASCLLGFLLVFSLLCLRWALKARQFYSNSTFFQDVKTGRQRTLLSESFLL